MKTAKGKVVKAVKTESASEKLRQLKPGESYVVEGIKAPRQLALTVLGKGNFVTKSLGGGRTQISRLRSPRGGLPEPVAARVPQTLEHVPAGTTDMVVVMVPGAEPLAYPLAKGQRTVVTINGVEVEIWRLGVAM